MSQLTEQMSTGPARIRVDVTGKKVPEHVLESMEFLNYRLAEVKVDPKVTVADPDLTWNLDSPALSVRWDGRTMRFEGAWAVGPIQKALISLLALRLEEQGLHPFHSAAVRYRGKTVLLLGGESNTARAWARSKPAAAVAS
jgi:hypothetical protein